MLSLRFVDHTLNFLNFRPAQGAPLCKRREKRRKRAPECFVNQILSLFGIKITKSWTSSRNLAIWAIIIVSVWRNAGYYMVMYLAGLQGVPNELYEAATMDGANGWQKFSKVTIPMLTPTTFFVSIMLVISCFKIYDVVAIMTQGGPGRSTKMLVTYIFELSFGAEGIATSAQYGVASAVSMVLLAIVLLVIILVIHAVQTLLFKEKETA